MSYLTAPRCKTAVGPLAVHVQRYRTVPSVKRSYKLSGREASDLSGKADLKNIPLNGRAQVCISALFTVLLFEIEAYSL